ncbi:hypothetical protein JZ751_006931 [Albula glossodonta]|uniref:Uncharacterized protein n=1 Tax=Albula glossodonta TaxID=121402 RepID=A0A8T2P482_9TELE|nr:hypothetical protein JZ751_006931 [Albula glossodonta]
MQVARALEDNKNCQVVCRQFVCIGQTEWGGILALFLERGAFLQAPAILSKDPAWVVEKLQHSIVHYSENCVELKLVQDTITVTAKHSMLCFQKDRPSTASPVIVRRGERDAVRAGRHVSGLGWGQGGAGTASHNDSMGWRVEGGVARPGENSRTIDSCRQRGKEGLLFVATMARHETGRHMKEWRGGRQEPGLQPPGSYCFRATGVPEDNRCADLQLLLP